MFVMVVDVREMTGKKFCKCDEYGSFEDLLLSCVISVREIAFV